MKVHCRYCEATYRVAMQLIGARIGLDTRGVPLSVVLAFAKRWRDADPMQTAIPERSRLMNQLAAWLTVTVSHQEAR